MTPKTPESASNPAREISPEEKISGATSIEMLYMLLGTIGTIRGSGDVEYNTKDIIAAIERLREVINNYTGDANVETSPLLRGITRSCGLRDKVVELLKQEQEQKD